MNPDLHLKPTGSAVGTTTWKWSAREVKDRFVVKLSLNDQLRSQGDDVVVEVGRTTGLPLRL